MICQINLSEFELSVQSLFLFHIYLVQSQRFDSFTTSDFSTFIVKSE